MAGVQKVHLNLGLRRGSGGRGLLRPTRRGKQAAQHHNRSQHVLHLESHRKFPHRWIVNDSGRRLLKL
jgi:hypothetical protein